MGPRALLSLLPFCLAAFGAAGACSSMPDPGPPPDYEPTPRATASAGEAAASATAAPSADPAGPGTAPTGPAMGAYKLVFQAETKEWTNQVVIAPWGDVVTVGGHKLKLLARDSGKELLSIPVCFVQAPDAAAFIDDQHLYVACDEGVDEVTFPQGTVKRVFKFPADLALTAIGGGKLVAAPDGFFRKDDRKIRVYALAGFKLLEEIDAGGPMRSVGVSDDGTLVAAGLDKGGVLVRDLGKKVTKTYLKSSDDSHYPVRFSPDGRALFTYTDSFTGGEIDLASGEVQRTFKVSSWLKTIRYVDKNQVLGTGADGLSLFSGRNEEIASPVGDLGEGLDLSKDGSFFCAAGRDGTVGCFSKKPVAASTFVPWKGPGTDGRVATPSSTPAAVEVEVDGEIAAKSGKTLTITSKAAGELKVGMKGELLKSFTQNIGFTVTGKIVIAEVEVKAVAGDKVTLTILEEKSQVTINGRKSDHFTPKAAVTLKLSGP